MIQHIFSTANTRPIMIGEVGNFTRNQLILYGKVVIRTYCIGECDEALTSESQMIRQCWPSILVFVTCCVFVDLMRPQRPANV